MDTRTFTFSKFLRTPNEVTEVLPVANVELTRRNEGSLVLMDASRARSQRSALAFVGRMLGALTSHAGAGRFVRESILHQAPWASWLPEGEREEMVTDLIRSLRAAAETDRFDLFEADVAAWRATAEVHADPELLARLSAPIGELSGEFGEFVEPPDVAAGASR